MSQRHNGRLGSADQPTAAGLRCEFVRPACTKEEQDEDQQPMFRDDYKRTNRTRATKIVRCFPHCCPEHRPRSYCGGFVHVQLLSVTDTRDDAIPPLPPYYYVFGRFEEHHVNAASMPQSLAMDQRVQASDILNGGDASSIWVKGELVNEDERSLFVLKGSDDGFNHWESDWKSGTSQRHRLTKHHFRVYVFQPRSTREWQVVGMVTSPPFTFAVYRKHIHDPQLLRLRDGETCTATTAPLPHPGQEECASPVAIEDSIHGDYESDDVDEQEEEEEEEDEEADNEDDCAVQDDMARTSDLLWHRQHRSAATSTTSIAILVMMASQADPGWLAMHSRPLFTLLQAATSTPTDSPPVHIPEQVLLHYVSHCVPQLMAVLPRHDGGGSAASHNTTSLSNSQQAMALLSELLCYILDPAQTTPVLAFISAHAQLPSLSDQRRRELFVQWIDRIAEQVEGFLQSRGETTESLVDEIVSAALANKTDLATHTRLRSLLRNTTVMGESHFDALLEKLRRDGQDPPTSRQPPLMASDTAAMTRGWHGTWIGRGIERATRSGELAGSSGRRHSWPQLALSVASSSLPSTGWNIGLMAGIGVILSAIGFTVSPPHSGYEGSQDEVFCVYPIASPLGNSGGGVFPLDHTFRDATDLLPLQWATLLVTGRVLKRVYCRARVLSEDLKDRQNPLRGQDQIELEFFIHDPDPVQLKSWRCTLQFALMATGSVPGHGPSSTPPHPHMSPRRRRMHVHVSVNEAQHHDGLDRSNDSVISDTVEAISSSHDNDAGLQDDFTETVSATHLLYDAITQWHALAAFTCVYYAV